MKWNWTYGYLAVLGGFVVLLFWLATKLAIVLFVAFLLTLLLKPLVDKLQTRISRGWASLVALAAFLGVFLLFFRWVLQAILPGFAQVAKKLPAYVNPETVNTLTERLNLPPEFAAYVHGAINQAAGFAVEGLKEAVYPLLHAMSGAVELIGVPFLVFYFLKDGLKLRCALFSFAPEVEQQRLCAIGDDVAQVLSGYIRGQLSVCLFSGVAGFLFFVVMGLPFPAVFAALGAFAEFIPVVGPVVVATLAVSLGLVQSTATALQIAVFYIVMLKINHNIVSPKLIGKAVNLHPVVIMIGLLFFGHLFGVLGMIMATPTLAVVRVLALEIHAFSLSCKL
ncbi:MAG: AI-2E family transporter [Negativicutes bacterium]|nr:AI-2E family transporter [Negativicutes bacterium]